MPLDFRPATAGSRPPAPRAGLHVPFSAQADGWRAVGPEPRSLTQRIAALLLRRRSQTVALVQYGTPDNGTRQFHVESMKAPVHPRVN